MQNVCNICGETCVLNKENNVVGGLVDCTVIGGYFSTAGNGAGALDDTTSYRFSICEFCLDYLFEKMKLPPVVTCLQINEEKLFKPAAQRVSEDNWRRSYQDTLKEIQRRRLRRKI
jgi:hypothetical protein